MATNNEQVYKISIDAESGMATIRDLRGQIVATQVPVKELRQEFGNFSKTVNATNFNKFNAELKRSNANIMAMKKGMQGASMASGSASASVMEMGRAISDSNYGIQGMANNMSQLASNLVFTTKAAGGFTAGMKQLWTAMMGPLGILVAIQTIIAVIEGYSIRARQAKKDTDEAADAFAKAAGKIKVSTVELETYQEVLKDSTSSTNAQKNALEELKDKGFDPAKESLDEFIEKQKELIILDATSEVFKNQLKKLAEEKLILDNEVEKANEKLIASQENAKKMEGFGSTRTSGGDKFDPLIIAKTEEGANNLVASSIQGVTDATDKRAKKIEEMSTAADKFKDLLKDILDLSTGNNSSGGSGSKTVKLFKEKLLEFEKEILKSNANTKKLSTKNVTELLEIEQEAKRDTLKLKLDSFKEDEQLRFDNFAKKQAKAKNMSVEEWELTKDGLAAISTLKQEFSVADSNYKKASDALTIEQQAQTNRLLLDLQLEHNEKLAIARANADVTDLKGEIGNEVGVDKLIKMQELLDAELFAEQTALDFKILKRIEEGKAYEDLTAKKEASDERYKAKTIKLETDTTKAKLAIIGAGFDAIAQIAGEGSEIGKAAAVAGATMNTYEAITAALGAKPYGPWNIAQAAVVGAAGFVQVRNILNTPIPGKGGGSSSGGGGKSFNPNFNVVGNSQTNQLADSIGGQVNEPSRAYVVYEDIQNATELNANAVESVGI